MSENKPNRWGSWIESMVISIVFMLASVLLHDPLSLNSPFPWIWFAPLLIALRYGLWQSQASIVLLLVVDLYPDASPLLTTPFQLFVLGGFLLTITGCAFQRRWTKKLAAMQEISQYLQQRTQSTADAYHIVSLAYQRLEQQYIIKPVTLRSALGELREMLARQNSPSEVFNRLLHLVTSQCSLEIAAIFPVKAGAVLPQPMASIGTIKAPKKNDFLIQSCLENATTTYVQVKNILQGNFSDYLLATPFLNQSGEIEAILLVESMPFLSLNDENIGVIDVLIQYFTAGHVVENAARILNAYPDCPVDFANELQRLSQLQKQTSQDSAVVAFVFEPSPHQEAYFFALRQEKRGLDTTWEMTCSSHQILLVLMPMTRHIGVESYKTRINQLISKEFDIALNEGLIRFQSSQLSAFDDPIHLLKDLLTLT